FLGDLALYADASLKPVSFVTVRGGVREELFTYSVENGCAAAAPGCTDDAKPGANPRTSAAASEMLPRVSLLLGAFDGVTLVGSYGRGVRSLAIDEAAANPTTRRAPFSSSEGGVPSARAPGPGQLTLRWSSTTRRSTATRSSTPFW